MMSTNLWVSRLQVAGRLIFASLFILAGPNKIVNFTATAEHMASVGLQPTMILLPLTIALELLGGLILARGGRWAVPTGIVLAIFSLATNWFFHRFWEMQGPVRELELSLFFKNVAIAGALLYCSAQEWARSQQKQKG
jgi:putative oxidoreductase